MSREIQAAEQIAASYGANRKNAWKECLKRLRKNPKDISTGLWRLSLLATEQPADEYFAACKEFCTLNISYEVLSHVTILTKRVYDLSGKITVTVGTDIRNAWVRLAEADRSDGLTGFIRMFDVTYHHKLWKDAQAALAKLRLKFPELKNLHFAWIAITQLAADAENRIDKNLAKLDETLARRLVQEAIKASRPPGARNAITNVRHLRVAFQIYRRQDLIRECLALYEQPAIAIVGFLDWEFVGLKIELMRELGQWAELHDYCRPMLEPDSPCLSLPQKEFAIWEALSISAIRGDKERGASYIQDLMSLWQEMFPHDWRPAALAHIDAVEEETEAHDHTLIGWICAYLYQFDHPHAWADVKTAFLSRDVATQIALWQEAQACIAQIQSGQMKVMEDDEWIVDPEIVQNVQMKVANDVNIPKLYFTACMSLGPSAIGFARLEDWATRLIYRCGESNLTERKKNDSLFQAMTVLVLLHDTAASTQGDADGRYLFQAARLLEYVAAEMKKAKKEVDRQIALMRTLIWLKLGLGNLALWTWPEVRVKDALSDSLTHLLLTRISISHPFAAGPIVDRSNSHAMRDPAPHLRDPAQVLKSALVMYQTAASKMKVFDVHEATQDKVIDSISPDAILESSDFIRELEFSICRSMWVFERRRILRLQGVRCKSVEKFEELPLGWLTDAEDSRCYDALPNFQGEGAKKLPCLLQSMDGIVPREGWLVSAALMEEVHAHLSGDVTSSADSRYILYRDAVEYVNECSDGVGGELLGLEEEIMAGWAKLRPLALALSLVHKYTPARPAEQYPDSAITSIPSLPPPPIDEDISVNASLDHFTAYLTRIHGPIRNLRKANSLPTRDVLHRLYLYLDFFKACHKAASLALQISKLKAPPAPLKGKIDGARAEKMRKAVSLTYEILRDVVSDWRSWIITEAHNTLHLMAMDGKTAMAVDIVVGPTTYAYLRDGPKTSAKGNDKSSDAKTTADKISDLHIGDDKKEISLKTSETVDATANDDDAAAAAGAEQTAKDKALLEASPSTPPPKSSSLTSALSNVLHANLSPTSQALALKTMDLGLELDDATLREGRRRFDERVERDREQQRRIDEAKRGARTGGGTCGDSNGNGNGERAEMTKEERAMEEEAAEEAYGAFLRRAQEEYRESLDGVLKVKLVD